MAILEAEDTKNGHTLEVRLLQELGDLSNLSPKKISSLWNEFKSHDVLFTDYTAGKLEPFLHSLINPRSVWVEIFDIEEDKAIGIMMATSILPNFDAEGHFTIWNGRASGKELVVLKSIKWIFDRYNLHRMTAPVPGYQKGVIRFIKRLGFEHEGEKRESVLMGDRWIGLVQFGMTRSELEAAL